jgi:hypothetical protein
LWTATIDLRLHLFTVLGSKRPAQPNPSSALTRNPFDLESHVRLWSEAPLYECNNWAIHNSLRGRDLEEPAMLGFEQLLFSEQTRRDYRVDRDQFD